MKAAAAGLRRRRHAISPALQVGYWKELEAFFERVRETDAALLTLCWGAMASLYHFHKVACHSIPRGSEVNAAEAAVHQSVETAAAADARGDRSYRT